MYITGGPASMPADVKSHYQSAAERYRALMRAGAVGVAVIPNPKNSEIPWARSAQTRLQPVMDLANMGNSEPLGIVLHLSVNAEHADKFFAGSGHSTAELLALADEGKLLPKFPLNVRVRAKVAVQRSRARAPNIIGRLQGSDPQLRQELVVLSAHLDHLGLEAASAEPQDNASRSSDRIYNGAMDNASGVASLIEIAQWFRETGTRPKRSLLFVAFTGEEEGELGSAYFCARPTVAINQIVADLNMDMFLPLFPLKYLQVQGLGESTLEQDMREVARANGVEAQFDLEPEANRFIRSDQYSFVRKGIPALAFKFGYLPNTPENAIYYDFVHTRYHAVSDDADNPAIDPTAAAQFDQIVAQLATRIANTVQRPAWNQNSIFRRFATPQASALLQQASKT